MVVVVGFGRHDPQKRQREPARLVMVVCDRERSSAIGVLEGGDGRESPEAAARCRGKRRGLIPCTI
jgi:hypothetical protein